MLLITRPQKESEEFSNSLTSQGIDNVISPLIDIEYLNNWTKKYDKIDKKDISIILFTSPNGIRAFAEYEKARDFTIGVVGKKSRDTAEKLGFSQIIQANGNASSLESIVTNNFKNGLVLYISGKRVTLEIANNLIKKGFRAEKIIVYQSINALNFSDEASKLFKLNKIKAVTLFSQQSAQNFKAILENSQQKIDLTNTKLFALSEKIAKVISSLGWRKIYVAPEVSSESILSMVLKHLYE